MTALPIRRWERTALGVAVLAPALLLAACGGSSSPTSASSTTSASRAPRSSTATAKAVTVETHSGAAGTYLTDGSGRTLYLFTSDPAGKSGCSGACATFWPPLTTSGASTASGAAKSSMLATITRSDGSKQVTYNGHPLYYFAKDVMAGDVKGQGINAFGAMWWVVSPTGAAITKPAGGGASPAPSSTGPSTSTSSGGGGYG